MLHPNQALTHLYGTCSLAQPIPPHDPVYMYADRGCHLVQLGLPLALTIMHPSRGVPTVSPQGPLPPSQILHFPGGSVSQSGMTCITFQHFLVDAVAKPASGHLSWPFHVSVGAVAWPSPALPQTQLTYRPTVAAALPSQVHPQSQLLLLLVGQWLSRGFFAAPLPDVFPTMGLCALMGQSGMTHLTSAFPGRCCSLTQPSQPSILACTPS